MSQERPTIELDVYGMDGSVMSKETLDARMFDVQASPALVHLAVVAQRANARVAIAHTKTRAHVSGGGRKPWKQKGTGRARHGSTRSPIWRTGGITFGPTSARNFAKKINKKAKRKALFGVVSEKVRENKFILVDSLSFTEPKTTQGYSFLKALPLGVTPERMPRVGLVFPGKEAQTRRVFKNIPYVSLLGANSLNLVDVLASEYLVLSVAALREFVSVYNSTEKPTE